jgi:hypothetical protein
MEQNKETIKENAPKVVAAVIGGTTATQVGAAGLVGAYLSQGDCMKFKSC